MRPTVSVIMNSLNGARYLREALESVMAQTYQDFDVIFWDDGSVDDSVRIAKSYGRRVHVYNKSLNCRLGHARQCAINEATGRYVAILDCDDTWEPLKLERQVAWMEKHPRVLLLASDCWVIDAKGRRQRRFFDRAPFPDGDPYRALLTGRNFLASPTLFVRHMQEPRFQATYCYAELYDWCVQMAKYWPIDALPQPLASYRVHPWNRGGTGCLGMTKEVLDVMQRHRQGAPMAQYVREAVLWARYGWQRLIGAT